MFALCWRNIWAEGLKTFQNKSAYDTLKFTIQHHRCHYHEKPATMPFNHENKFDTWQVFKLHFQKEFSMHANYMECDVIVEVVIWMNV